MKKKLFKSDLQFKIFQNELKNNISEKVTTLFNWKIDILMIKKIDYKGKSWSNDFNKQEKKYLEMNSADLEIKLRDWNQETIVWQFHFFK